MSGINAAIAEQIGLLLLGFMDFYDLDCVYGTWYLHVYFALFVALATALLKKLRTNFKTLAMDLMTPWDPIYTNEHTPNIANFQLSEQGITLVWWFYRPNKWDRTNVAKHVGRWSESNLEHPVEVKMQTLQSASKFEDFSNVLTQGN